MNQPLILPSNYGQPIGIDPVDPAVSTSFIISVPVNAIWLVVGLNLLITTDANAANRTIQFTCNDGSENFCTSMHEHYHTASKGITYFGHIGNTLGTPAAGVTVQNFNLCPYAYMRFGDSYKVNIGSKEAGDQISSIHIRLLQWIQE